MDNHCDKGVTISCWLDQLGMRLKKVPLRTCCCRRIEDTLWLRSKFLNSLFSCTKRTDPLRDSYLAAGRQNLGCWLFGNIPTIPTTVAKYRRSYIQRAKTSYSRDDHFVDEEALGDYI